MSQFWFLVMIFLLVSLYAIPISQDYKNCNSKSDFVTARI